MNKLISILLILLLVPIALAQEMPAQIIGQLTINGVGPTGYHIEVRNLDNPDAIVLTSSITGSLVTERGKFAVLLNDFGRDEFGNSKYTEPINTRTIKYPGDRIQIKVVKDGQSNDVSCASCIYTFNVPLSFPYYFDMKVVDSTVQVVEKKVVTEKTVEKEVIVTEYVCSDGTKAESADKCPKEEESESNLIDYLIGLIVGILALFGWGKGFAGLIKYYINKAKEEEKKGNKELAQRYRERAKKMTQSIITGYLAGKYK